MCLFVYVYERRGARKVPVDSTREKTERFNASRMERVFIINQPNIHPDNTSHASAPPQTSVASVPHEKARPPLNLHFVWIKPHLEKENGDENEQRARAVAAKWGGLTHTRLYFWTRAEVMRDFPELVDTLTQLSIAAWISDLLRYHVVNRYGGLYLDTDVYFLKDPAPILERNQYVFTVCQTPWNAPGTPADTECESVINAIIAATPGHPALICAIEEGLNNTRRALQANGGLTPRYDSANTGPVMWTRCAKQNQLPLLPSWTFLPCPCCEGCIWEQYVNVQDAYGMHQWIHSWW